nr:hypothetical protein GCM10017745_45580 [Saccharothrix mutabilis subsp. capreolus]
MRRAGVRLAGKLSCGPPTCGFTVDNTMGAAEDRDCWSLSRRVHGMSRTLLFLLWSLLAIMGAAHRRNRGKFRQAREEAAQQQAETKSGGSGAWSTATNAAIREGVRHAHHVYDEKRHNRKDDDDNNGGDDGGGGGGDDGGGGDFFD